MKLKFNNSKILILMFTLITISYMSLYFVLKSFLWCQFIVAFSAGIAAYSILISYSYFGGILSKIYKPLLIAALLSFFLEVAYFVEYLLHSSQYIVFQNSILIYILITVLAFIAIKNFYIFWIEPVLSDRQRFYKVTLIALSVALILSFLPLALLSSLDFMLIIFSGFIASDIFLMILVGDLCRYLKRGIFLRSLRYVILGLFLGLIGELTTEISFVLNLNTLSEILLIFWVYAYLMIAYGFFKQRIHF